MSHIHAFPIVVDPALNWFSIICVLLDSSVTSKKVVFLPDWLQGGISSGLTSWLLPSAFVFLFVFVFVLLFCFSFVLFCFVFFFCLLLTEGNMVLYCLITLLSKTTFKFYWYWYLCFFYLVRQAWKVRNNRKNYWFQLVPSFVYILFPILYSGRV